MKVQIARPVDAAQQMPNERGNVVNVEVGVVVARNDEQVLRQRHLALPENRRGLGEQLLRLAPLTVRHITLAANGQEQRVYAGRIDGVYRVYAGNDRGNNRPRQLVNERPERRVFLRRTSNDRERPDRAGPM